MKAAKIAGAFQFRPLPLSPAPGLLGCVMEKETDYNRQGTTHSSTLVGINLEIPCGALSRSAIMREAVVPTESSAPVPLESSSATAIQCH